MTDHLEPYRRMARSIRFFPPLSLEQPPQASVALEGTPALGISSTRKTIADDYEISALEPPIDPSEHVAALVHEAVSRPTVLPTTYAIQENIGDRISRLATPKPPKTVTPSTMEFKIPQSVPEYNGNSAHPLAEPSKEDTAQQADDANLGASSSTGTAVAEPPTVLTEAPEPTIEEDTNQQLEAIQPEPPATSRAEAPAVVEIPEAEAIEEDTNQQLEDIQPEVSKTEVSQMPTGEEISEPEAIEEDTNQQLEDIQPEVSKTEVSQMPIGDEISESEAIEEDTNQPEPPTTVVAEDATVEDIPEAEAIEEDTKKQIDDNHSTASATVSTEAQSVAQTPSDEAGEVVVEPSEVENTPDADASSEDAVEPVAVEQTIDEGAAVTAFQQPEVETEPAPTQAAVTEIPATDTVELLKTDVAAETSKAAPAILSQPIPTKDEVPEAVPAGEKQATDTETDEMTCPQCESTNLKKNGRRGGKQRYACKDCGKQFVAEVEEESKKKDNSRVETAKIKDSEVEAKLSDSSKRSSKKKTKAKGFGNSKVK